MAKVAVRADPDGETARRLSVPLGRAARDERGTLVVGSGPGEWLLLGAPGQAAAIAGRVASAADTGLVTIIDSTHARALVRVTGADAARMLSKVCAIDLSDDVTPDGAAFRSYVAAVVTDVVRDDVSSEMREANPSESSGDGVSQPEAAKRARSYLLHCERSSGQYLFDCLLDGGAEFGIEVEGFAHAEALTSR